MLEQANALLELLIKRGFQAYFIGGKCRNELNNEFHETKAQIKDIDIVTNAKVEDLLKLFPSAKLCGAAFQVVIVNFGGVEFEVATYRRDIYNSITKGVIAQPATIVAKTLDEDRERRDFTINAITQNLDGQYIDFKYKYRNKNISSVNDIKNRVIRAIGNPTQRFQEDPIRMLRAFRFMSQLGYEIEPVTLKSIQSNLKLLQLIPHERFGPEFNKIISGNFAYATIILMRQIGVFDLYIKNSYVNSNVKLLPNIFDLSEEHLQSLTEINIKKEVKFTTMELWAYLLQPLGSEVARINLESFYPINKDEIEKVEWLIQHYDLILSDDLRLAIYNAKTGIVRRKKLMCMKELLINLCRIYKKMDYIKYKKIDKIILDQFCSRPYFAEQLNISGQYLMDLTGLQAGPWISEVKEKIILNLIAEKNYPYNEDNYNKIVQNSVNEILHKQL